MQRMGTEAGREIFGDQVWTNLGQMGSSAAS